MICTIAGLGILAGALVGRKYLADWIRTRENPAVQIPVERKTEPSEETQEEDAEILWEERLKVRKKELRQTSHQILQLQERGEHLAAELEEKKIQVENLQEELREISHPTQEEEECDMELSGLNLAVTVLERV